MVPAAAKAVLPPHRHPPHERCASMTAVVAGWLPPQVQIEEGEFIRDPGSGLWQFANYRLAEVPEALARTAELQAQDMAAAGAAGSGAASL
jgi:hypothetical protein